MSHGPVTADPGAAALLGALDPVTLWVWSANLVALAFAFAFGACVGSLTNVLVFRLPRGIGVVTPPSACPSCGTQLTWRENIPVFGWLLLRGRCRFCSTRISPEYPVVEAVVGLLFAAMYALWYILPSQAPEMSLLGFRLSAIAPDYASVAFAQSWPPFVLLLLLIASLVAMTIVDAKTYTIPLILAWVPTGAAVIVHVGYALWCQQTRPAFLTPASNWAWIIPGPGPSDWRTIGAAIGGVVGVGVANVLLYFKLIRPSFADYDEWEAKALAEQRAAAAGSSDAEPAAARDPSNPPVDMWVQYPHARREVFKELVFLAPVLGLGFAGIYIADWFAGPWTTSPSDPFTLLPARTAPLWLVALASVLLGYLVGGGVVWGVRLLGAMAFGKEAMGLGDVHLLAAVGACMGWIDPVVAFFLAAFVGLLWAVVGAMSGQRLKRALPFGPYLAIGAVLAIVCKPVLWALVTRIMHAQVPIRWP